MGVAPSLPSPYEYQAPTAPVAAGDESDAKVSEKTSKQSNAVTAVVAADVVSQFADPSPADASADDESAHDLSVNSATAAGTAAGAGVEPAGAKAHSAGDVRAAAPQPPLPPEVEFGDANHDRMVTSVNSQLMPNGGTMHMRLDPPELGVLQITVKMVNGVMTASFETSSSEATKLLSHSLGQLKASLESQGVSVEKLQVQESPKNQQNASSEDGRQQQSSQPDDQSARQEQQRRELLKRMWRRLGIGNDPLDMVA